jgi:MFS transporter, FHS family, L-fucose permease
MATITPTTTTSPSQANGQTYRGPFAIMTSLFFLWGFMTVFNDVLIPRFKDAFTLDYYHAMLVQLAFFGAYFFGSLLYFIISWRTGDPIARIGYKNGVVIGLLISALGSALFWPAANLAPRFAMIFPGNLPNAQSLVEKLNQPKDPVSVFIHDNLSDPTRQMLAQTSGGNQEGKTALSQDLDKIINGPLIYDEQRFSGVKFQPTTSELLEQVQKKTVEGNALVRLNRALLEDAYPGEITKNLLPYWVFLAALFIVGLGFAMLQIAANPYVTILGPERTASSRLNLAQGFNSIGTTIGPLIGGYLIFQYFAKAGVSGADSVKMPYLAFCIVFLILAVIFFFIDLPHIGETKIERGAGALKYPHVILGVIAIFMYVGGEVSVGSAIISFLKQPSIANLPQVEASKFVAIYWGGLMIGRFMGAVELSEMKKARKQILLVVIPLLAYLLLWAAKSAPLDALQGGSSFSQIFSLWKDQFVENWSAFKIYLPFVGLCWLLFQFGKGLAARTLVIFSCTVVVLLLTAIFVGGKTAMWCVVAVGLFTSIGWSNTFSLALEGTGAYKSQVSSLLVMAILGGALLPVILGKIADISSLQLSFIVPLIAYTYVAFYGWKGHRIGRKLESPAA